jgi:putative transposase
LRNLRSIVQQKGSKKIAWIDESGFKSHTYRAYAWGKIGAKVYDERPGKREKQTNLIMAKQGRRLLAPVLYQDSTTALWFNQWLEEHLFKELEENSTLILDNASFHQKEAIRSLAKENGHDVLFLPPYSPDFNPIEKVFANLKKRRIYATAGTTLDQIVKSYGSFLE